MNANQPGYWAGLLLGGTIAGAIAGLLPLFLGTRKSKTGLAVGGFLASVAGGLAAGIIGGAILAGIFSLLIRPWNESATAPMQTAARPKGSSALAWYLVAMFPIQTILMAVFWSFFMSLSLGKSFFVILIPVGAGCGLTFGIFMTAFFAVSLRPGTTRFQVVDLDDFLTRLERTAGKLRYRLIHESDGTVVLEPKTLLRTEATRVSVELGADEAVATGPNLALKSLQKAIEKP